MNLRKKILISILILILFSLWGIFAFGKNISDFLFWYDMSQKQQMLSAELSLEEKLWETRPTRDTKMPDLEITAESVISVLIKDNGEERILFEKSSDEVMPIASLTKLMTAWVVLEHYDLSEKITVSESAASQYGEMGKLQEGEIFPTEYLLYPLLMESSNGAAFALSNDYQGMTERNFVGLMNSEAKKIGLKDTFFDNPSGLDPEEAKTGMNYSTAADLAVFSKKLLEKPLVWEILSLPTYSLYGPELTNTNKFLLNGSGYWQSRVIGGKTGYTDKAGGCLLLALRAPKGQGILINIILGADGRENRFDEMKKLVEWVKSAHKW
jgi:D-alanyl-D-alanine carboxypeptidase